MTFVFFLTYAETEFAGKYVWYQRDGRDFQYLVGIPDQYRG